MKRSLLILIASLGLAAAAPASMLTLNYSGSFGPTTTLDGTPLGAETPFSLHATFDSTTETTGWTGQGVFPISSFSILLPSGTYTAAPAADLNVYLGDPASVGYFAGLLNGSWDRGFITYFNSATPDFSASLPTPSLLVGPLGQNYIPPYTIVLDGGAGSLEINDLGSSPFAAAIATVPEPASWAMMGLTFCGVAGYGYRRYRAARA